MSKEEEAVKISSALKLQGDSIVLDSFVDSLQPVLSPVGLKDGDMVTNENGAKQSFLKADFEAIPAKSLRLVAQCLGFGRRRYGFENWKKIPIGENLSHAMNHINEWNCGDRSEPHLVNAIARLLFALTLAVESKSQPETYIHPSENEQSVRGGQ